MRGWHSRFRGTVAATGTTAAVESLQGPLGKVGTCDELIRRDFSQHVKQKEVWITHRVWRSLSSHPYYFSGVVI